MGRTLTEFESYEEGAPANKEPHSGANWIGLGYSTTNDEQKFADDDIPLWALLLGTLPRDQINRFEN